MMQAIATASNVTTSSTHFFTERCSAHALPVSSFWSKPVAWAAACFFAVAKATCDNYAWLNLAERRLPTSGLEALISFVATTQRAHLFLTAFLQLFLQAL